MKGSIQINQLKLLGSIAILLVALKLLISPISTGDFANYSGKYLNVFCDAAIVCCILLNFSRLRKEYVPIYVVFIGLLFTYVIASFLVDSNSISLAITNHFKVFLPILFFTLIKPYFDENFDLSIRVCCCFVIGVVLLLLIGGVFFPPSFNRTGYWWPSYYGGVHTTAYVAMSVTFLVFGLHLAGLLSKRIFLVLCFIVICCVSLGWGVRTVTGALLVFVIGLTLDRFRVGGVRVGRFIGALSLAVLAIFLISSVSLYDLNSYTSGRISMYESKFFQLSQNTVLNWLIGNGAGSDFLINDVWWWEAKGAHSDFLTLLVEGGTLYLIGVYYIIYIMYKQLKTSTGKYILLSLVFASLFSNGYFIRPIASYLFFMALALIYSVFDRRTI